LIPEVLTALAGNTNEQGSGALAELPQRVDLLALTQNLVRSIAKPCLKRQVLA